MTTAACKGQKSVSSLGRVMGFEGKTNLHDTKAEHNHTNSPHQTENEIGQIVDYLNGVIGSKGRLRKYQAQRSLP